MTRRRKVLAGLALAAAAAIAGCLDALAPGAPRAFAHLGVVPVFDGVASHDGIPADVDSIVVTIHNPPAADIVVSQHIAPGQDSIVITVDVPLVNGVADTVTMGFSAIRSGPPATVLYQGSQEIAVRVGVPSRSDSVRVTYVGPGQNLRSITLSPRSVAVRPGDSVAFNVVSLDSTGATIVGMPVFFQSRNLGVVTVTLEGTARGVTEGSAYVVATSAARSSVRDSALVVVSTSPVATISLAPTSATFTATAGGASPASQTVAVTNSGVGALGGLSVSGIQYQAGQPTGWLAATLGGTTAPATLTLQASTGGLGAGTYTATVSIASAQAANTPQSVTVTFTVGAGPAIGLSSAAVTFTDTISTADNAAQTVTVSNSGAGALSGLAVGTVTYGTGATGWLTATLNQATAPATLTLSAAKGSLAAGSYTATVPITSGVASNSPQSVTVTFVVVGGPAIGLSSAAVTFTDTISTADNAAQSVTVSNSGAGTLSGLAVGTVTYGTGATGWLTATLNQATAPATLTLSAAKGSLAAGSYTATVPITSGVASNSPQSVTVTFVVVGGPAIGLSSAAVTFTDTISTADNAAQTVTVSNSGAGALSGLAVGTVTYGTGATGWLTATLNQATAPATLTLSAAKGSLAAGSYTATVPITSGVASNSPQSVTVTFVVVGGPAIGLSSAAVTFTDTISTADNAAQTVTVSNSGAGALSGLAVGTVTYGTGATGWLTATLNQATAPATLTLSAAKGSLAAGSYAATVPITSGVASNSPQTVTVTFVVAPGPSIGLATTTATFTDTIGTSDPAAQAISVSNNGNATLTGLTVGTVTYGTGPTGWLTATLNQATAPATLTLSVAKGSLVPGLYTATVPITSGVASNSPQTVTVTFDLRPVPLASIQVNPGFAVLVTADTLRLQVAGKDGAGNPMTPTGLRFVSRTPGAASVDSLTGLVTGVAAGTAVVVASAPGGSGPVFDSLLVAVPASGQAVAYLITNGRSFASVRVGDSLGMLVGVDLRAVPAERLGSYNAQLDWSPAVATFQSIGAAQVNGFVAPTVNTGSAGSGQVRFGAADPSGATAQPVGLAAIRLMASASGSSPLTFTLTDLSAAITFTNLLTRAPAALVVSGAVRVQ